MGEPQPVRKDALMNSLPPPWPDVSLRQRIANRLAQLNRCVVVLDDDPLGTQTLHDTPVLATWEVADLCQALDTDEPALCILTNTRSMPLLDAQTVNREIISNLSAALRKVRRPITVVSRSDSTLRGHFPGEVNALAQALVAAQGEPFDGICLVPSFPEAGRLTVGNFQWVQEGELLIPAAQTPYARDPVFGYAHSHLPEWVEERTAGAVPASQVLVISLDSLRRGGPTEVAEQLRGATNGRIVVADAADYRDLEVLVWSVMTLQDEGMRFLFRTAASFVRVAAGLSDRELLAADELVASRSPRAGLIVFGSCVPKSTAQLAAVRALDGVRDVELSVPLVLDENARDQAIGAVASQLDAALAGGLDALAYTSRTLVAGSNPQASLRIGQAIGQALAEVVRRLRHEPRYVLAKGGATAGYLATHALGLRAGRVLGQVQPGVPVWQLGPDSRWPGMPYVAFPGNVGQEDSVADILRLLSVAAKETE